MTLDPVTSLPHCRVRARGCPHLVSLSTLLLQHPGRRRKETVRTLTQILLQAMPDELVSGSPSIEPKSAVCWTLIDYYCFGQGRRKNEEIKGIDLYQLVNQGPCLIRRNGIDTPVDRLRWLVHSLGPLFQGSVLFGKLWWV
jgi:hypothetical protein